MNNNAEVQHHSPPQPVLPIMTNQRVSVMVRIDLKRLPYIATIKKRQSGDMRQKSDLTDMRQHLAGMKTDLFNVNVAITEPCEQNPMKAKLECNESDSESNARKLIRIIATDGKDHEDKSSGNNYKRKRRNSNSSVSSMSTVGSNVSHRSSRRKEKDGHKSKRRKGEAAENAQRTHVDSDSLTDVPPTNHERGGPRTPPMPSPADVNSGWSQSNKEYQYHSYFDRTEEPSEDEEK